MSASGGRGAEVWRLTYDEKLDRHQIAARLGIHPNYVYQVLARHRAKLGLPPLGMPRPAKDGSRRGRPPGGAWVDERPSVIRARIEREVSQGTRCPKCWLLLPCDHKAAA